MDKIISNSKIEEVNTMIKELFPESKELQEAVIDVIKRDDTSPISVRDFLTILKKISQCVGEEEAVSIGRKMLKDFRPRDALAVVNVLRDILFKTKDPEIVKDGVNAFSHYEVRRQRYKYLSHPPDVSKIAADIREIIEEGYNLRSETRKKVINMALELLKEYPLGATVFGNPRTIEGMKELIKHVGIMAEVMKEGLSPSEKISRKDAKSRYKMYKEWEETIKRIVEDTLTTYENKLMKELKKMSY